MIRRLTKRTELEIVAQWPNEGDITEDATPSFLTSLLEDCSPDPDNEGKLSTRAPEELMRLLASSCVSCLVSCSILGSAHVMIFVICW